ncbi:MAG: hypothetical protein ACLQUZ_09890, partial [Rhizomicrobium sp.]
HWPGHKALVFLAIPIPLQTFSVVQPTYGVTKALFINRKGGAASTSFLGSQWPNWRRKRAPGGSGHTPNSVEFLWP